MRQRQLLRAWLVAGTATGCGATSHLLAGGHFPNLLILALATSLAALLTLAMTRMSLNRPSLLAGVLCGQGLLHGLYSHSQPLSLASSSGHLHAQALSQLPASSVQAPPHSVGMWVGHLLAALATYSLLAYGERMLCLLRALLGVARRFFAGPSLQGYQPPKRYKSNLLYFDTLVSSCWGSCHQIRGPPTFAWH